MAAILQRRLPAVLLPMLLSGCGSAPPAGPPAAALVPPPEAMVLRAKLHSGHGWAVAAPEGWTPAPGELPPGKRLHLVGDGRGGFPPFDGTLAPMQVGLMVEATGPEGPTLKELLERDVKELETSPLFRQRSRPVVEEVALRDSTPGWLLKAEFEPTAKDRLSFSRKLYAEARGGHRFIVTGLLVCGAPGGPFVKQSGLLAFLEAHVASLVFDPQRRELDHLAPAYTQLNRQLGLALQHTQVGNQQVDRQVFVEAAVAFRDALAACDVFPAAHNGLAWALLNTPGSTREDLSTALRHAERAVQLSDRRDVPSLDTLALAYFRQNRGPEAIAVIEEALKIEPGNDELRAALARYRREP